MGAGTGAPSISRWERAAFAAIPLALHALVIWLPVGWGLPLVATAPWIPSLGVRLAFRVDGLAELMLLLITFVGGAVFVHAGGYLAGHPGQRRVLGLLVAFMLAMIGCVTADDLVLLFLFWELTSVLSFLLVGTDHEEESARKAARQALFVTGTGGLALLGGVVLVVSDLGTTSISEIVDRAAGAAPSARLEAGVALLAVGAFTKSAQVPFHFWLPNAMAAPTPVSAYLHSATMVKLGVYLLARLDPAFGHWDAWELVLVLVGSITSAWGMVLAIRERDLKRVLAWSTVATLGTLVMLVGLRTEGAPIAVGALLLAHALYKAALFFVAGNVDHGTGTRRIDRLGGLRRKMPWTAAAAALAGASMAGLPLSFGHVAKSVIKDVRRASDVLVLVEIANTIFSAIAIAIAGVAAVRLFWSKPPPDADLTAAHEGGPALVIPPLALSAAGVVFGVMPLLVERVLTGAASAMEGDAGDVLVELSSAATPALGSLALSIAAGVALFFAWEPLRRALDRAAGRLDRLGALAAYEALVAAVPPLAARVTRLHQHGRLPIYAAVTAGAATLALGVLVVVGRLPLPPTEVPSLPIAAATAVIVAGALLAVLARERLVLVLSAGLAGYGSAVTFLFAGAPDLAFTQVVVETVFVVVIATTLSLLVRRRVARPPEEPRATPWRAILAAGFATSVVAVWLAVQTLPLDRSVDRYYAAESVPVANGRNVVNVVLVDFRAIDTLGEITVVLLSLVAAAPLLRALRRPEGAS